MPKEQKKKTIQYYSDSGHASYYVNLTEVNNEGTRVPAMKRDPYTGAILKRSGFPVPEQIRVEFLTVKAAGDDRACLYILSDDNPNYWDIRRKLDKVKSLMTPKEYQRYRNPIAFNAAEKATETARAEVRAELQYAIDEQQKKIAELEKALDEKAKKAAAPKQGTKTLP